MSRNEARRMMLEHCRAIGIPTHIMSIRPRSGLDLTIARFGEVRKYHARTGITREEIEVEMERLQRWWDDRKNQIDLVRLALQPTPADDRSSTAAGTCSNNTASKSSGRRSRVRPSI